MHELRREADLWLRVLLTADGIAIAELCEIYASWVRAIAKRAACCRNLPGEIDDLVQCGLIGLWQALHRYDFSRGVAFTTFAAKRVKGAMIELSFGQRKRVRRGAIAWFHRIGDQAFDEDSEEAMRVVLTPAVTEKGFDAVDDADELRCVLSGMDPRVRDLMQGVFLEGLTFKQAGARAGISESRVSQLMARVLNRARREPACARCDKS